MENVAGLIVSALQTASLKAVTSFFGIWCCPNPEAFGRFSVSFKYSLPYRMLICHMTVSVTPSLSQVPGKEGLETNLRVCHGLTQGASSLLISDHSCLVHRRCRASGTEHFGEDSLFRYGWWSSQQLWNQQLASLTLQCISSVQQDLTNGKLSTD